MKKVNVSASFRVATEQAGRQFSKPKVGTPIEGQHPQDTNNNEAASSNSETTNTSKSPSSKPKSGTKKYRLGRIHVYQEEKNGTYRVFFFYDKQRCLGSFTSHAMAEHALQLLRNKLQDEDEFNDKESTDELVAYIRNTVRGGVVATNRRNATPTKTSSKPSKTSPKPTVRAVDKKDYNANNVDSIVSAVDSNDNADRYTLSNVPWSKEDECKLLLSALDNPLHLLEHGYPSFPSITYNEYNVRYHWNKMLQSYHNSNVSSNIVSKTSSNERTYHVLQTCVVLSYEEQRHKEIQQYEYDQLQAQRMANVASKKNKETSSLKMNTALEAISTLKSNALLACGWHMLPFAMVASNKRSSSNVNGFNSSQWYSPSPATVSLFLNEKQYVKSSMPLNEAWDIHMQELRNGIQCDLPPQPAPIDETMSMEEERRHHDGITASITPTKKKGPKKGSKSKHKLLDPGVIPKHVQNMMAARARFTTEGDQRPSIHCTWCGPKQWSRKVHKQQAKHAKSTSDTINNDQTITTNVAPSPPKSSSGPPAHVICKGCQLLYRNGWRMDDASSNSNTFLSSTANNRRWADYVFRNKDKGISLRSVKTFLLQTSPYVADIMVNNPTLINSMEETMVIPKYKKERGGGSSNANYSGDGIARVKSVKRRKIAKDDDSSDDEHSIDSASSSSSSCSSSSDEANNNEDTATIQSCSNNIHNNTDENNNNAVINSAIDDIVLLPSILSTIPNGQQQPVPQPQTNLKLPTIDDLLKEEYGLSGILQSDEYGILNVHFGNDAEIICQVLAPLTTGKLPRIVFKETPLLRSKEELDYLHPEGGPPPARFMGVTRIFEKTNIIHDNSNASTTTTTASMGPNGKFGVEIPLLFYKGRKVILRDFDREDVAGLLFGFLYRLLFGNKAFHDMSIVVNDKYERKDIIYDTLCAFGAIKPHIISSTTTTPASNVIDDTTKMDNTTTTDTITTNIDNNATTQDDDMIVDKVDDTKNVHDTTTAISN